MSDLSIHTALENAVSQPRKAAPSEVRSGSSANVPAQQPVKTDISNYVTSPKGVVDPETGVYVLQYRDGATGEVLNQYPSAKVVDAYKHGDAAGQQTAAPTASSGEAEAGVEATVPAGTGGGAEPAVDTSGASVGPQPTSTSVDA